MSSQRDAVLEVGAAEQVGDVLGLGARGVEGADLDRAGPRSWAAGLGVAERVPGLERDRAGERRSGARPCARRAAAGSRSGGWCGARPPAPGAPSARREVGREVEDAAHVGAAEAVDRLVGVADDREVAAVAGERPQQRDLAGVGVLVLVDEDVAELARAARRGGLAPRSRRGAIRSA